MAVHETQSNGATEKLTWKKHPLSLRERARVRGNCLILFDLIPLIRPLATFSLKGEG